MSSWMQRALELARFGEGRVEPNPQVGAVVLDAKGQLAGEGWHQEFGGPHAEVQALQQAAERSQGGTLYVTLEPCNHHGKTPPCTEAVIRAGLRKVVIGCPDPAPHTHGQGIERLRQAGLEVELASGAERSDAEILIAPFQMLMVQKRPFVHAKWAMTLDGKIATRSSHSQWISSPESREIVHQLRGRMDGILVGIGTVLADDPLLTARPAGPRTPLRIVLDSQARLPHNSRLIKSLTAAPLLVFVSSQAPTARTEALRKLGVQIVPVLTEERGLVWHEILAELYRRRLTNLLVEGGSAVLGSLWEASLIDEVHAFIAPKIVGGTAAFSPVGGTGAVTVPELSDFMSYAWQPSGPDIYFRGRVRRLDYETS